MGRIFAVAFLFLVSAIAFFMSVRSFMGKGFLFNNAYIYATKQEREKMDKGSYYRQSAIVFLMIGLIFIMNALDVLFKTEWIFYAVIVIAVGTLVYAVWSSLLISARENSKKDK